MDIYSLPTFNLTRLLLTAEATRTPYTLHLLDLAQCEHKRPERLSPYPHITRWLEAMRARPACARALDQLPGRQTFAALAA